LIPDRLRVGFEGPPVFATTVPSVEPIVRAKLTRRLSSFAVAVFFLVAFVFFIFPLKSVFLHMIFDQCDAAGSHVREGS